MREHFWSVAVQDIRSSSIRARAIRMGNKDLWLFYLELLLALKENGGVLPADPVALADEVGFWAPDEIEAMLPLLAPAKGKRGGIIVEGETLRNQRIDEDNMDREGYLQTMSILGERGGKARVASAPRDERGRFQPPSSQDPDDPQPLPRRSPAAFQPHAWKPPGSRVKPDDTQTTTTRTPGSDPDDHQASSSQPPDAAQTNTTRPPEIPSPTPPPSPTPLAGRANSAAAAAGSGGPTTPPECSKTRHSPSPPGHPPQPLLAHALQGPNGNGPPLLEHDSRVPEEAELARVCRELVDAGLEPDDAAALRAISLTSKGLELDSIRGAPGAWVRRSIADGRSRLSEAILSGHGSADLPPRPLSPAEQASMLSLEEIAAWKRGER